MLQVRRNTNRCRYCDEDVAIATPLHFHRSCDIGKIVVPVVTLWKLGFPPPNDHLVFDQVRFDLVKYHQNCNIIKSINMLHFMDVATSLL
jgi:hypothetical protein